MRVCGYHASCRWVMLLSAILLYKWIVRAKTLCISFSKGVCSVARPHSGWSLGFSNSASRLPTKNTRVVVCLPPYGWSCVDKYCKCSNEASGSIKLGKFVTSWGRVSFSGRTLHCGVGWLVGWLVGRLFGWLVPILMQLNYTFIGSRWSSNFRNAVFIQ